MTDHFLQEKFDNRRFLLLNINKIWQIAVGAVAGACLFAFIYYLKTDILMGEPLYRAQTLYEIVFDREQVDNIHDYYNDYTWNEVLDSDRIAGRAAEILGDFSKEEIAAATTIPTMSDIRFIWVYVDMESGEQADRVMMAIGESLREFALSTDGFKEIVVWDVKKTEQISKDSLIGRMTVAGAVIGALAACFVICFVGVMDDSIYTEKDAEERFGVLPAGVIMRAEKGQPEFFEKELGENLKKLIGDKLGVKKNGKIGYLMADPVSGVDREQEKEYLKELLTSYFPNADVFGVSDGATELPGMSGGSAGQNKEETDQKKYQMLRELDAFILQVPYGKKDGMFLELVWKDLALQGCLPDAVVIIGADEKFYRRYYRK